MARTQGARTYKRSENDLSEVQRYKAVGVSNEQIASALGISHETLVKNYGPELELGLSKANAAMAGALYRNGMAGNIAAQIFWLKTKAGWRDMENLTPQVPIKIVLQRGATRPSKSEEETEEAKEVA